MAKSTFEITVGMFIAKQFEVQLRRVCIENNITLNIEKVSGFLQTSLFITVEADSNDILRRLYKAIEKIQQ